MEIDWIAEAEGWIMRHDPPVDEDESEVWDIIDHLLTIIEQIKASYVRDRDEVQT